MAQRANYNDLFSLGSMMIWSACFLIPLFIFWYLWRKKDEIQFRPLYLWFACFLWFCAAVHFLDAGETAVPHSRPQAAARIVAGLAGWCIVAYLLFRNHRISALPARKHLEQELLIRAQNEARLQQKTQGLAEAERIARLTHAYWDFSRDRIDFSESGYELFGLTPGVPVSFDGLLSLVVQEDRECVRGRIEMIRRTRDFDPFYLRINVSGYGPRHFLAAGRFLFESGDLMVCTLQDITSQHDSLQQMQNARLNEIASIQSHQVRGQVATIMGLSDIFNYENPGDPANLGLLKDIRRATQNLDDLIHEIVQKASVPKS